MRSTTNCGNLISLTKESHQKLSEAKQSHIKLAGANLHKIQSDAIPATFLEDDNNKYHRQCYQKYTMAISMLRKKTTALTESSRPSRTGELGNTLFPDYCICKKILQSM